jgi:hypothetical protein
MPLTMPRYLSSLRLAALCVIASCATLASAQLPPADPDWKEADAPPPPAFELNRLVPFDVSVNSQMKWGIDPQAMVIGVDSVVRYVVVAQSPSGVMNAMYEGIRCASGEFKTYARYNKDSGWNTVAQPQWQPFLGTYAHRLARQGVCTGAAPAQSVREVVRTMRQTSEKPR